MAEKTWLQIIARSNELASRLSRRRIEFDSVVAIARAGAIPGVIVAERLMVPRFSTLEIEPYDREKPDRVPRLKTRPGPDSVPGRRVLLIDDVWATGDSMTIARAELERQGAQRILEAVLYFLPAENVSGRTPDVFIREETEWPKMPWEGVPIVRRRPEGQGTGPGGGLR